jgi:hypothetical protein
LHETGSYRGEGKEVVVTSLRVILSVAISAILLLADASPRRPAHSTANAAGGPTTAIRIATGPP